MKLDRPIVIWTGVVVMLSITTFQFLIAKTEIVVTTPLPLTSPPTDAGQKKGTYKVTRPVRETRKKVVEYTVTRPVREQRTRTVRYTQMTVVREQHTKTDPGTGEVKQYTVAKHVPEHREKVINYTVCKMVSEKKNLAATGRGATSGSSPIPGHPIKNTAALNVPGQCGEFWFARSDIATSSKQPD